MNMILSPDMWLNRRHFFLWIHLEPIPHCIWKESNLFKSITLPKKHRVFTWFALFFINKQLINGIFFLVSVVSVESFNKLFFPSPVFDKFKIHEALWHLTINENLRLITFASTFLNWIYLWCFIKRNESTMCLANNFSTFIVMKRSCDIWQQGSRGGLNKMTARRWARKSERKKERKR